MAQRSNTLAVSRYHPLSVGFAQHPTGPCLAVHLTFVGSSFLEYLVLITVTVPRKP